MALMKVEDFTKLHRPSIVKEILAVYPGANHIMTQYSFEGTIVRAYGVTIEERVCEHVPEECIGDCNPYPYCGSVPCERCRYGTEGCNCKCHRLSTIGQDIDNVLDVDKEQRRIGIYESALVTIRSWTGMPAPAPFVNVAGLALMHHDEPVMIERNIENSPYDFEEIKYRLKDVQCFYTELNGLECSYSYPNIKGYFEVVQRCTQVARKLGTHVVLGVKARYGYHTLQYLMEVYPDGSVYKFDYQHKAALG